MTFLGLAWQADGLGTVCRMVWKVPLPLLNVYIGQSCLHLLEQHVRITDFCLLDCTFHRLGPLAFCESEVTSETVNPFQTGRMWGNDPS